MDYLNFRKLLAFFSALKDSGFRSTLKEIPNFTVINKQRIPINKNECLKLLRLLPDFQSEDFKDDNNIVKYLSDPRNRERILGKFSREQRDELTKTLEQKPFIVAEAGNQLNEQEAPTGQEAQSQGQSGASSSNIPLSAPTAPSISPAPRVTRIIPQVTKEEAIDENEAPKNQQTDKPQPIPPQDEQTNQSEKPKLQQTPLTNTPSPATSVSAGTTPPASVSKFNPSALKSSVSTAFKGGQNFAARANPFLKTNLARIGNGLGGMVRGVGSSLGGIGGAITGPGLTSVANFGGRAALGGIYHGGNFLSNLSNARSRLSATSKSLTPKNLGSKRALLIFSGIFFLIFFMGVFGGIASDTSTGEAAPNPTLTPAPTYQPSAGKGVISCPLNGQTAITNRSKDAGGHCSRSYEQDYGVCAKPEDANYTGKETAIDVTSSDRMVYIPRLNNTITTWTIDKVDTNTGYTINGQSVNGGYSIRASASAEGKSYLIRFVHMDKPNLQDGQSVQSDTAVGTYRTQENHVHITVKEDGDFKPADLYFNLCQ